MAIIKAKAGSLAPAQEREIEDAIDRARRMSDRVWGRWSKIYGQVGRRRRKRRLRVDEWKSSPPFMEWFGWRALRNGQFNKVNRRLRKVRRTLQRGDEIKVIYNGSSAPFCCSKVAWNGGFRRGRIHVCNGFFVEDAQEQATTIVHEMVHATGISQWGQPGRGGGNSGNYRERASHTPRKARRNPYNYERLFVDFDPGP
ncbi:MAG TPA: M35 family metallo-endopeptidase [Gemmatimonadota bacterium]|nr:M35 family metallo-endopeptidase [Gemmatimonadota bacterium]